MAQELVQPKGNTTTAVCVTYQKFLETEAAPKTKAQYAKQLERFMRFLGVQTHDELIYSDAPANTQKYTQEQMTARVERYVLHLKAQGLRRSTVLGPVWAIKFFYEASNAIALPWSYLSRKAPINDGTTKKPKAYSKEQIRLMMQAGDIRANAIILYLASTGVRAGSIEDEIDPKTGKVMCPGLTLKSLHKIADLLPADEPDYETLRKYGGYLVTIYEGTTAGYFTFTTPEAAKAIDAYLAYRAAHGEQLTPDSPLFRETFDPANRDKAPGALGTEALASIFKRLQIRVGMRPADAGGMSIEDARRLRHDVKAVHGFRAFANTSMRNCKPVKLDIDFRKFLLGHSNGLQENYYDHTQPESVESALIEYLKAVEALTIDEAAKVQARLAVANKQLAEQNKQLATQKEQLEQADAVLQAIKGIPDSVMQQLLKAASTK